MAQQGTQADQRYAEGHKLDNVGAGERQRGGPSLRYRG
jgi:hypothetical protein